MRFSPSFFAALFFVFFALTLILRLVLSLRQSRALRAALGPQPRPWPDGRDEGEREEAVEHALDKLRLGRFEILARAALTLAFLGVGFNLLGAAAKDLAPGSAWGQGAALFALYALVLSLFKGFFSGLSALGPERRHGFNRAGPGRFFAQWALRSGLAVLSAFALGAPLSWFSLRFADDWAWMAWLLSVWLLLAMRLARTFLGLPLVKRRILEDGPLKARIEALLNRAGYESGGVFVVEAPKRPAHCCAVVWGIGRAKRVALFDAWLNQLNERQIEAMLARELGGLRLRCADRRLAWAIALIGAGFGLAFFLSVRPSFYFGLGLAYPTVPMALCALAEISGYFLFPLSPVFLGVARRHEREADAYAAKLTDPRDLSGALAAALRANGAPFVGDPLHALFFDGGQALARRLADLGQMALRAERAERGAP